MSRRVAVELPYEAVVAIDREIAVGRFRDRSEAIVEAVARLVGPQADGESDPHRRSYKEAPEEEIFGEIGLRLLADRLRDGEKNG